MESYPGQAHTEQLWYRFTCRENTHRTSAEVMNTGVAVGPAWGFRFTVAPVAGVQWLYEAEVLTKPSLVWACWLMDQLLSLGLWWIGGGGRGAGRLHEARV